MLCPCKRLACAGQHKLKISRHSWHAPRRVRPIIRGQVVAIHSAADAGVMVNQPLARRHARANGRTSDSRCNFPRWFKRAARQLSIKRLSARRQRTTTAEKLPRRKMRG
jgi:hypothetical protein